MLSKWDELDNEWELIDTLWNVNTKAGDKLMFAVQ